MKKSTVMAQKIPVEISHSGDDLVGRDVAFSVKEAVRGSTSMTLAADLTKPRIKILMISLAAPTGTTRMASAIAVAYLLDSDTTPLNGALIALHVHTASTNSAREHTRRIIVNLGKHIDNLKTEAPSLYQQLGWRAVSE